MSKTRTIRLTVQLTVDEYHSNNWSEPVENSAALGEIARAWWKAQKNLLIDCTPSDCQHSIRSFEAEVIGIEEPKAHRYSSAFLKALGKKREQVEEIWGQYWS